MTELSKLLPVVFATVQLAILLIVPVSEVVTAHRATVSTINKNKKKHPGHVCTKQRRQKEKNEEARTSTSGFNNLKCQKYVGDVLKMHIKH